MRKTLLIILLIFSLNLGGLVYAQSPLWNPNYNKVQKLIFDNSASAEDLVNFTVLVHLNSSIIDWDDFQVDGNDIRFIDEDYETYLDYEIETWNHGYDAWIWVRVPQINMDSAIDHIYMYYDNPLAVNGEDKEGTWNDNYVMVQHMVDETNATILDSTQYDNDGTKEGANEPIETTGGQINNAQDFDGTNDYVDVAPIGSYDELSIGTWVYIESLVGAFNSLIHDDGWALGKFHYFIHNSKKVMLSIHTGTPDNQNADTDITFNEWLYLVVTYNKTSGDVIFYRNGQPDGGGTYGTPQTLNVGAMWVGGWDGGARWFNGTIDSVRISNTIRSGDWIEAQYLSMTENYITYKELSLCESKANIFPLVLIALFVIIGIVVVSRA